MERHKLFEIECSNFVTIHELVMAWRKDLLKEQWTLLAKQLQGKRSRKETVKWVKLCMCAIDNVAHKVKNKVSPSSKH